MQLAVNLGPLSATCAPPIGEVGVAYNQPACVPKLGLPPYTCALLSGTPSAGTTLNGDCTLSGTPTTAGSKTFVTRVADSGGLSLNVSTTQTVQPVVQITTSSVAAATLNESFTTTLMATGGKPGYTWSVASGTLPAGLGLSAGGILSGTPTTAGISNVTFRATDTLGGFADQALQLTVNLGPLSATCTAAPSSVNVSYTTTCSGTGGLPPYSCTLGSGTPPNGIGINADCTVTGTPTVVGSKTFVVKLTDSAGASASASLTINPANHVGIATNSLPVGKVGTSYSTTLTFTPSVSPYTWSIVDGGPLPANLSLNTATGAITGTPQPGSDGAYPITFRVTDGAGGTADKVLTLTILNTQSLGQWAGPFESPIVSVHGALLRNGTVVLWDALESGNDVHIWNPATNTFTATANSRTNIFCSGHCTLPDGRIFVAGGHVTTHIGLRDANIFDPGTSPATSSWTALPDMANPRWYPTATTLPDGRVLVTAGEDGCSGCNIEIPEIYNPATNTWTSLTDAPLSVPFYPHMFVLPDGRVLAASTTESEWVSHVLDLTTHTWSVVDPTMLDGGSAVMFRPGKIMKSGTHTDADLPPVPSADTTYVLDMTQPSPAWQETAPMAFPRGYHNLTMLPDGNVLVTGGGDTTTPGASRAPSWPPSSGRRPRRRGRRWRRCRRRASTTRSRCSCPTAACWSAAAGGSAARRRRTRTRSRSSRRPTSSTGRGR